MVSRVCTIISWCILIFECIYFGDGYSPHATERETGRETRDGDTDATEEPYRTVVRTAAFRIDSLRFGLLETASKQLVDHSSGT